MVTSDDLLSIGFYRSKINANWLKWKTSDDQISVTIYFNDNKPFEVEMVANNYFESSCIRMKNIKTLKQIQNLIKALEGEE